MTGQKEKSIFTMTITQLENNSPDLDNFVGAAKKFFQDSMVKHKFIEEDNVNVIVSSSEKYCGIDRKNPRIEAKIQILE